MTKVDVEKTNTATQILDVAERLVQVRGFNDFSYRDVARELQLTNAALHYHFTNKAALGEALLARYLAQFLEALEAIVRGLGLAPSLSPRSVSFRPSEVVDNLELVLCLVAGTA